MDDRLSNTVVVRLVLWRAAGAGAGGSLLKWAFGSGPESMPRALTSYAGAPLHALEAPDEVADRAHSDALDRIVMFGAAGLAAHLAWVAIGLAAATRAAGLIDRGGERRFAVVWAAAAIVAVGGGTAIGGTWTLALSVPAALVLLPALAITTRRQAATVNTAAAPLAIAAIASIVAHVVDVHTSIVSVTAAAANAFVLGFSTAIADGEAIGSAPRRPGDLQTRAANPPSQSAAAGDARAIIVGLLGVLAMVALTPPTGATAATWTIALATMAVAAAIGAIGVRGSVIAVVMPLAAAIVWLPLTDPAAALGTQARALAAHSGMLAGFVAVVVTALVWRIAGGSIRGTASLRVSAGAAVAALVVGAAALHTSSADVAVGAGAACESNGDLVCALDRYQAALAVDPSNTRALTRLARVDIAQADRAPTDADRRAALDDAARHLAHASSADPYDYHHPRNEAALERRRAAHLPPSEDAPYYRRADRAYQAAIERAPAVPELWAERANLALEEQQPDAALSMLERAL